METKFCGHCNADLPVSQFYTDRKTKSGLTAYCKRYYADYYRSNKDRQQATSQRARIKRRYGLDLDTYQRLIDEGCAVCGSKKRLHIDHCHKSGITRGVLCSACNVSIGHAHDDPQRLRDLADWLESKPSVAQGLPGASY